MCIAKHEGLRNGSPRRRLFCKAAAVRGLSLYIPHYIPRRAARIRQITPRRSPFFVAAATHSHVAAVS